MVEIFLLINSPWLAYLRTVSIGFVKCDKTVCTSGGKTNVGEQVL
jgi:hypothetical protein